MLGDSPAEIRAELKRLQDQLRVAVHHERIEALKKDVRVLDWIEEVRQFFDDGDYEKARKTATQLYRALNAESINTTTTDYQKHFARYVSAGNAIRMPEAWGFCKKHIVELERGLTYSIGARPGTGKTTILCNLAYHYALEQRDKDFKVGIFTNEMKEGQLWVKLFQIHLNKTEGKSLPFIMAKDWLRYPRKYTEMYKRMCEFAHGLSDNLRIANVRRQTGTEICMAIDEMKNDFMRNIDIGFLDYIQRIPRDKATGDERLSLVDTVQQFSEKMMDIDAVLFVFSQMNKDGGFKGSEAPQEEAGIAWEISRDSGRDGKLPPFINWRIVKSRITAYFPVMTRYDDRSGTLLNDIPLEDDVSPQDNPFA
jgi:hypothetical protein